MQVTFYPQPGKRKAQAIAEAFVAGVRAAGGDADVCTSIRPALLPGGAAFYGVRPAWRHLWDQARAEGRAWYFVDNAYFDSCRERYFRATREAMQCDGLQAAWGGGHSRQPGWDARWRALGLEIRNWRFAPDGHVVVCPQSPEFMATCCDWPGDWLEQTVRELRRHTDRPLRIRPWRRNKGAAAASLRQDLAGAWALVTHMSCAADEALLAGVPVFCTGRCAARWMGSSALEDIERPVYPARRDEWAMVLANNQWTLDEMARGDCWKALHA